MEERQELFERVATLKESDIDYFLNPMAYNCAVWIGLTKGETLHHREIMARLTSCCLRSFNISDGDMARVERALRDCQILGGSLNSLLYCS